MEITLLIPTHAIKRPCQSNQVVNPIPQTVPSMPSTKLIETMLYHLYNRVFNKDIKPVRVIIGHDFKIGCDVSEKYHENLQKLCDINGFELQKNSIPDWNKDYDAFLRSFANNFKNLYGAVKTEYLMMMEHDWAFLRDVDMNEVKAIFDDCPYVNHLRFNTCNNNPFDGDTRYQGRNHRVFDFVERRTTHKILKTDGTSNRPHFMRTSHYTTFLSKFINLTVAKYGPVEGAFAGIMESLMALTNNDYENVLPIFGNYIMGHEGEPAYIHHLDTNSFT
jgi:hypothetical protein